MNNTTIRTACIPASTGIMNARFIAGMYGDLVHGKLIAADQLTYAVSPVHQPLVPPGKRGNFGLAMRWTRRRANRSAGCSATAVTAAATRKPIWSVISRSRC